MAPGVFCISDTGCINSRRLGCLAPWLPGYRETLGSAEVVLEKGKTCKRVAGKQPRY